MPVFKIIENNNKNILNTGWANLLNFKSKDRIVDEMGKSIGID